LRKKEHSTTRMTAENLGSSHQGEGERDGGGNSDGKSPRGTKPQGDEPKRAISNTKGSGGMPGDKKVKDLGGQFSKDLKSYSADYGT